MGKRKPTRKPPEIGQPGGWPGRTVPDELELVAPPAEPPLSRRQRTVLRRKEAGLQPLPYRKRWLQTHLNQVWPAKYRTEGPDPDHYQGRVWWYDPEPIGGVSLALFAQLVEQRYRTEHLTPGAERKWPYKRVIRTLQDEARAAPAHFQTEIALLALEGE